MKKLQTIFTSVLTLLLLLAFSPADYADAAPHAKPHWQLDHVVLMVKNLNQAIKDFSHLGFTVLPGGKHAGDFDHNALIPFPDGSYLELYATAQPSMMDQLQALKKQNNLASFTSKLNAMATRFINHIASGEGVADFALTTPDLDLNQAIAYFRNNGISLTGPIMMDRIRPDGQKVIWKVAVPQTNSLPFLIKDVTPRALRLGVDHPLPQPNGTTGIANIIIVVPDLAKSAKKYQAFLGIPPAENISHSFMPDAKTVVFTIGAAAIILAQPANKHSRLYRYLQVHGPGPYSIALYTTHKAAAGTLDPLYTHHANIQLMLRKD